MSYILDSLKKSEQQRRDGALPGLQSEPLGPVPPSGHRRGWIAGVLATLLGGVALLTWLLVDRPPQNPGIQASVPSEKVSSTAAPPVAQPAPVAPPEVQRGGSESVAVPERQQSGEGGNEQGVIPPQATDQEARLAPVPAPAQSAAAMQPTASILYQWDELPASYRQGLPALQLSMHYYSGGAQGGLVRLNGQMLRPGDALEGGLVVDEIVPDGVVLEGRGFRVLLQRP